MPDCVSDPRLIRVRILAPGRLAGPDAGHMVEFFGSRLVVLLAARPDDSEGTTMNRFILGQVVITPGATEALLAAEAASPTLLRTHAYGLLRRHVEGDWGELDAEDKATNERAVKDGYRILSAYTLPTGARIWIITEADRSVTTLLLPEEY